MKRIVLVSCFSAFAFWSVAQYKNNTIPALSALQVRQLIDTCTAPTIVNFWATWCGPCLREIPYFEEQVKGTAVRLVLVNIDDAGAYPEAIVSLVQKNHYTSPVIYLNEKKVQFFVPIIEKKWSGAIPASIFVNNAKQYYRYYNGQLTRQRLALELKKLLE